jgi:hypothetical protein
METAPLDNLMTTTKPTFPSDAEGMTPAERIRAKAATMRSRGTPWNVIAAELNKAGYLTVNQKQFTAITAFKLVNGKKKKQQDPGTGAAAVVGASSFKLEMARAAALAKSGTPEERLAAIASFLQ